jgi:hypothetical protein
LGARHPRHHRRSLLDPRRRRLPQIGLLVAVTFATLACIALTGKRLSAARLAASVTASQLAFHLLFSLIGTSSTVSVVSTGHHGMSTMVVGAADASASMFPDPLMWFGHAIAAVATFVLLRFGEAAFWRLAEITRLLVRVIRVPVVTVVPTLPGQRVSGVVFSPRFFTLLRSSLLFRGPPVSSLA